MKNGALIFAHNSETLDYLKMSLISAKFIKKNLNVPVCIVTDQYSLDNSDAVVDVENLIVISRPEITNYRNLNGERHPFINSTRNTAWKLTPFERTLVIDSDVLVMSDHLSQFWDGEDFLICERAYDILGTRLADEDIKVSDHTINLRWATTMMFTKNDKTEKIFDTVEYIKQEYRFFSDLYEFDPRNFRNDIAFSIANHLINGFVETNNYLPPPLFFKDSDSIVDISEGNILINIADGVKNILLPVKDFDIHFLNKKNILENYDKLMELACSDI